MSTVLVAGGAGYIGSHTCKALSAAGYTPVVFDNLSSGHEWAVQWGPLCIGDIQDADALADVIDRHQPIAIIHFAADALVGESVTDPAKYYRNNTFGSFNLLETARRKGVNNIVFSSTCASYGIPTVLPIPEEHPQVPINAYGSSKLAVEHMLAHYAPAYGLNSVALRYFNAAGASPDGDLGEEHDPETHLIPLAIGAALGSRPPLRIFGTDYDTPDGTAIRDYIHVCDLADAHVAALRYLLTGGATTRINLGTGEGMSVRQMIALIEKTLGVALPCEEAPRRAGDPPVLIAEARKAAAELGWRPRSSTPEQIIESACRWHAARASGAKAFETAVGGR
jgi:UDP-glucose-4-epimerase GalE